MSLLRRPVEPSGAQPDVVVVASVEPSPELADEDGQPFDASPWALLAEAVLRAEGVPGPGELALAFVGEAAMAELNEEWMGETGPTDVLSFPLDPFPLDPLPLDPFPLDVDEGEVPGVPRLLGDVVVCPPVARRYAEAHGRPVGDELALLVVHGVLHVLGHDHAEGDEEAAMQAREDLHLREHHDPRWTRSAS